MNKDMILSANKNEIVFFNFQVRKHILLYAKIQCWKGDIVKLFSHRRAKGKWYSFPKNQEP